MATEFEQKALDLLEILNEAQWHFIVDKTVVKEFPIMTRSDLQNKSMEKLLFTTRTSGSTGEQVYVEKTYADALWHAALTLRSLIWRRWDFSLSICQILPFVEKRDSDTWGLPNEFHGNQGKKYILPTNTIDVLQEQIEEIDPNYIVGFPSLCKLLDTSKLTNFVGFGGTGELGGDVYSSEECGIIAIRCPDNNSNYHVSENMFVEVSESNEAIITVLTNPYIKRYKIGDVVELGECDCGRSLQTITKINGRIRNMLTYPNGTKRWPEIGSKRFFEDFHIKRFQAVQKTLETIEFSILIDDKDSFNKEAFVDYVRSNLGHDFLIEVRYVESFPTGKFEEFKSLI